jgi:diphthamide synthase (EF-2-diphthine--ammonia ligase)
VELDADGLCPSCRDDRAGEPAKRNSASEEEARDLDRVFRSGQGRAEGQYDAVVLFSGGKDSTYLLHRLRRAYPGLRILTLLVDNGFMSPVALDNAGRVRAKFDVDHFTLRPRRSAVKAVFRYALTHIHQQNGYSIVDLLDAQITFDSAKHLAERMEIPLIVCGISRTQADLVWRQRHFEMSRDRELAAFRERAGVDLHSIRDEDGMSPWWDASRCRDGRKPRLIMPFVVWDPDETFIMEEVGRLGLLDRKRTSPLQTNNFLVPVLAVAEVARFGYSCFEVEFARMIREGKSERGYWLNLFEMLEYSARTGRFINGTITETLDALDLSSKDLGIQP